MDDHEAEQGTNVAHVEENAFWKLLSETEITLIRVNSWRDEIHNKVDAKTRVDAHSLERKYLTSGRMVTRDSPDVTGVRVRKRMDEFLYMKVQSISYNVSFFNGTIKSHNL